MAGLEAAKASGRKGCRKAGLSKESLSKASSVKSLFDANMPMEEIAKSLHISRATRYRYLDYLAKKKE